MRPGLFAVAAFVCLALAGCGVTNSTPGCGAGETLDLVKEIIQQEIDARGSSFVALERAARTTYRSRRTAEQWKASPGQRLVESFTLELVITTAHDKELDTYTCSANLEATSTADTKVSLPFNFAVRPLATDPTQFVVQVSGLGL